jgi:hypothetical protein
MDIERDKCLVEAMGWKHWNSIGDKHFYINHDESDIYSDPKLLPDFSTWENFGILINWLRDFSDSKYEQFKFKFMMNSNLSGAMGHIRLSALDPDRIANSLYKQLKENFI